MTEITVTKFTDPKVIEARLHALESKPPTDAGWQRVLDRLTGLEGEVARLKVRYADQAAAITVLKAELDKLAGRPSAEERQNGFEWSRKGKR